MEMNMNRSICLTAIIGWMFIGSLRAQTAGTEITVISDVHVMNPSLIIKDGSALDDYMKHDRKMLKESPALLDALTSQLLQSHPQFVLLTGDLTKDGEEISHRYLVDHCLSKLKASGIQTLVIPGNHDINNPHAVSFNGSEKTRVPSISAQDFARIYADYGYGKALARDSFSLSYVYQLTPRIRILALDACKYEENDFDNDICRHDGRIKPETLAFIKEQLVDARQQGMRVIAMMHHGLTAHWKYQNKVLPGYVVDDHKRLRNILKRGGVEVIFTGHSHAQDIAYDKGIYDIETGSLVSYPSPFREVTLKDDTLSICSNHITAIDYDIASPDFQSYARKNTKQGFKTIVASMFPKQVPENLKQKAIDIVAEAMSDHYKGDEILTSERQKEIKDTSKALRKYSFKWSLIFKMVTRSLWSDIKPADNDFTLILHDK